MSESQPSDQTQALSSTKFPPEIISSIVDHAFLPPVQWCYSNRGDRSHDERCSNGEHHQENAFRDLFANTFLQLNKSLRQESIRVLSENFIWARFRTYQQDLCALMAECMEHAVVAPPSWHTMLPVAVEFEFGYRGFSGRRRHERFLMSEALVLYDYHTVSTFLEQPVRIINSISAPYALAVTVTPTFLQLSSETKAEIIAPIIRLAQVLGKSELLNGFPEAVHVARMPSCEPDRLNIRSLHTQALTTLQQADRMMRAESVHAARWCLIHSFIQIRYQFEGSSLDLGPGAWILGLRRADWKTSAVVRRWTDTIQLLFQLTSCVCVAWHGMRLREGAEWLITHRQSHQPLNFVPTYAYFGLARDEMARMYYYTAMLELEECFKNEGDEAPVRATYRRMRLACELAPNDVDVFEGGLSALQRLEEQTSFSREDCKPWDCVEVPFTDADGNLKVWKGHRDLLEKRWSHDVLKLLPRAEALCASAPRFHELFNNLLKAEWDDKKLRGEEYDFQQMSL